MNIQFSAQTSARRNQSKSLKQTKAKINQIANQIGSSAMQIGTPDFCTCNRWDWIINGVSFIKTDKRHKKLTRHPFKLRLVSPIDDNSCWVEMSVYRTTDLKRTKPQLPKRVLLINTWIEKTPEGFKLHVPDEMKRASLEKAINKFARHSMVVSGGIIRIANPKKRNKKSEQMVDIETHPRLVNAITKILKPIALKVGQSPKIIAQDAEQRKKELLDYFA